MTLITTQYAKAITPTIRGNTDFILIMKTIQGRQREALEADERHAAPAWERGGEGEADTRLEAEWCGGAVVKWWASDSGSGVERWLCGAADAGRER